MTVTDSYFQNNKAKKGGGAIYTYLDSTLTVLNTIFRSNTASGTEEPAMDNGGGAIWNGGTLNVTGSTFEKNSAKYGEAIVNYFRLHAVNNWWGSNQPSFANLIYNDGYAEYVPWLTRGGLGSGRPNNPNSPSDTGLYLNVTASETNPLVGEAFLVTYKLGNYGPADAKNVTLTLKIPEGLEVFNIDADSGTFTYSPT